MTQVVRSLSYISILKQTVLEWNSDGAPRLGAALAFYSILSLGPLLLIVISVAGLVFGRDAASTAIIDEIKAMVGGEGAKAINEILLHSHNPAKSTLAASIGIVTLFVSITGFFGQLQVALNIIFNAPPVKSGVIDFVTKRLLSFGMVVGIGIMLMLALVISAGMTALTGLFQNSLSAIMLQAASFALSFIVTTLLFALTFKVLPDVRIKWRSIWLGAGITAALFTVGKSLIGLYLGQSAMSSTYGAAGSLIVLLVWIYYSTQIIFLGAEFTQVHAQALGETFPLKRGLVEVSLQAPVTAAPPPSLKSPSTATNSLLISLLSLTAMTGLIVIMRHAADFNRDN